MIVVRAPLRISFVGGGTDLSVFYKKSPGRVISTAIDKFVYIVINKTPFIDKIAARYSVSELVEHPKHLQNTRIKAALLDMGIYRGIEIASFADLPSRTGLGSSSSFSVVLMKGLAALTGKKMTKEETAEEAARLEIDLIKEPIGKQDQYATSLGGFNILQFNNDDSVTVDPVLIDFKKKMGLEDHMLVFFTGIARDASTVLSKQKIYTEKDSKKFNTLRQMSESVDEFSERLQRGDFKGLGYMLHDGWLRKKSLTSNMSSTAIDEMYDSGLEAGAWGGKILGAGGGGCILFLAPFSKKNQVRQAVKKVASKFVLKDFKEIPIKFVQSGAEIQLYTE